MSARYHYEPGAVRWFRWTKDGDVRGHCPPEGWEAMAEQRDTHPITGFPLKHAEWWMRETFVGEENWQ